MPSHPDYAEIDNLIALLRWRAEHQPEQPAYTYLVDGEAEATTLSYGELDRRARALSCRLNPSINRGERALLLYAAGLDFIVAFFGCLYAAVIAVPAYQPGSKRRSQQLRRLIENAGAKFVLSTAAVESRSESHFVRTGISSGVQWVNTDELPKGIEDQWKVPMIEPDSLALLQYTSGSTGQPRGVMVSHGNLLHNQAQILNAFALADDTRIVSWLPFNHDMGLSGGILQPLYGGFPCVLMSPTAFLQSPYRWLQAISRHRATVSGGPNFAYDLCVQRISPAQRENLDLSCWRVAFNGAEAVRAKTLEGFQSYFGSCGFRKRVFYPCYGLGEATLLVSGGKLSDSAPRIATLKKESLTQHRVAEIQPGHENVATLVSCGRIEPDQQVLIVNPRSLKRCAQDEVGEIWITSRSVAKGYWNQPEPTRQIFTAYLADSGEGPFLRTGDLGFLSGGELFLAGRWKDLIIVRGRNYHPQEIEWTAERSHLSCRPGCCAAFSIDCENRERLIIVQEINHHPSLAVDDVIDAIRKSVGAEHELDVQSVVLIRSGSIPKTSSGKIRRFACRDQFQRRTLAVLAEWSADQANNSQPNSASSAVIRQAVVGDPKRSQVQNILTDLWSEVLGVTPGVYDNFFALGGDSLSAAQLITRLQETFCLEFAHDLISRAPTILELENAVNAATADNHWPKLSTLARAPRDVRLPLSFAQERMWLLEQLNPGNPFYNIAVEARLNGQLDIWGLKQSLRGLLGRHEVLRARFSTEDGIPVQSIASDEDRDLPLLDLSELSAAEREAEVKRLASSESVRPFDFARGPMLRVVLLKLGATDHVLILTTHHLVCDGWGIGVLIKELNLLYAALAGGTNPSLPPLPVQYADYAWWQRTVFANSSAFERQAEFWRHEFARPAPMLLLPTDFERPAVLTNEGLRIQGEFDREFTQRLKAFAVQSDATLFIILLWALMILIYRCTGQSDVVVGTVVANRGRKEVEPLIGCFVNFLVLRSQLTEDLSAREALERIKNTTLNALANQDYPFERLVSELNPDRSLGGNPLYSVGLWLHNYSMPQLLEPLLLSETRPIDTHTADLDLRIIATETADGRLALAFEFSAQLFTPQTISAFFQSYRQFLEVFLNNPHLSISDPQLNDGHPWLTKRSLSLVVAANFTAEPIESFLSYWFKLFGQPATVQFAPYDQVFQQLLQPASLFHANRLGINLILLRLEHWATDTEDLAKIEANVKKLLAGVRSASDTGSATYFLALCPSSSHVSSAENFHVRMRELIWTEVKTMRGVYALDLAEAVDLYDVQKIHDDFTDELGSIPFTREFFAGAGTFLARKIFAVLNPPCKVALLDCDNTLWKGVCGEDGYQGVEITPSYRRLQEFMLRQKDNGLLLALCSKNNESDVLEVFQRRSEMVLKLDSLAAWRINWEPKSQNLKALVDELQFSSDSFICVDDDPLVCAEIRKLCPEALMLQLPEHEKEIPKFLDHVWAFDRLGTTAEDKHRAVMYNQSRQREQFKKASLTMADFLAGLELKIEISPMKPARLERVAQLMQRVNQFNISRMARTKPESVQVLTAGNKECWIVEVSDNFGDYGLVGVIIFDVDRELLNLDTFLLSCRALGREVEFEMFRKLVQLADERNCREILTVFRPTEKNNVAFNFLKKLHPELSLGRENRYWFRAPIASIRAALQPRKSELQSEPKDFLAPQIPIRKTTPRDFGWRNISAVLNRIANEFQSAESIVQAVIGSRRARPKLNSVYLAPRTPIEETLAKLWAEVLGIERIGVNDNFFEFGGHSLLGTQLLSRVREEFLVQLSLNNIFENPTIAGFTSVITRKLAETLDNREVAQMLEEVQQLSQEETMLLLDGALSKRSTN